MAGLVFVFHHLLVVYVLVPLLDVLIAIKSVKEKMEAKSQVTATLEVVMAHLAAILAEILAAVVARVAVIVTAILAEILLAIMGGCILEVGGEEELQA